VTIENIRTVPSKEFTDRFGAYREAAQREPIGVTNHGRVSAVLISAHDFAEYQRLKQYDTRKALHPSELDDEMKAELDKGYQGRTTPELDHLLD
jgi:prevent-host-death family protein